MMFPDRVEDRRIDGEIETRGESDRPEHAHRVLANTLVRVANRPYDPDCEVLESADVVDNGERRDVVEERVDGEVAPECIFLWRSEGVVPVDEQLPLRRRGIRSGDGDLDDLLTKADVREAKPPADDPAVSEQPLDLIGVCGSADVEVFRVPTQEQ